MMHFVFQAEHRTMTAFILAVIVNSYTTGQVSITAGPALSDPQEWYKGAGLTQHLGQGCSPGQLCGAALFR